MGGQLYDKGALSPGKEHLYQLDRRLGGPQTRCEEEKVAPSAGNRTSALHLAAHLYVD
jgi:hypothetical protein